MSFLVCITILLMPYTSVNAAPPLPSRFYGTVKINGENAREGTIIRALINGLVVATTTAIMYQGESVYSIDVPGDDPTTPEIEGGKEGDMIRFMVAGFLIRETATWQSGTDIELNLSITANATLPPPQPTEPPPPTQTLPPSQTPPPTPIGLPTQTPIIQPTRSPITGLTPAITSTLIVIPTSGESPVETVDVLAPIEEIEAPQPTQTDHPVLTDEPETPSVLNEESSSKTFLIIFTIIAIILAGSMMALWRIRKSRKGDSGLLL